MVRTFTAVKPQALSSTPVLPLVLDPRDVWQEQRAAASACGDLFERRPARGWEELEVLQSRRWLSADDAIAVRGVRAAWSRPLTHSGRRGGGGGRWEAVGTQWCN